MDGMWQSVGLLGDEIVELIFGNNTVSIIVGSIDHFLQDGVVSELS